MAGCHFFGHASWQHLWNDTLNLLLGYCIGDLLMLIHRAYQDTQRELYPV